MSSRGPRGVFVGLATLDVISRVEQLPPANGKVSADWQQLAAGGPATGAAVVFAALGGQAHLVTRIGQGPVAQLVRADLAAVGVQVSDLAEPGYTPPVSSVSVHAPTGDRQVVGRDAPEVATPLTHLPASVVEALRSADVVLLDGHHPDLARSAAGVRAGARLVLDAGRYKPVFADVLPVCTDVIASSDFTPPGESDPLDALVAAGVSVAAVSAGGASLRWRIAGEAGELHPPKVQVLDTLGAGDTLHGAYAFEVASGRAPLEGLIEGMRIASTSCTQPGTRSWLTLLRAH
ncbi:PfkB family carbohydrate kinase [Gephyromycinifex aptenodytis]|uniref:PfkB family carbohydrate kinase n=1 Tax=Gephyromycinifex aptenodytis TaxID=2716227 RepID=UPI00144650B7|nr:PfkB family carbohydrate kinase [Gephyromycinifex aptenodytis]